MNKKLLIFLVPFLFFISNVHADMTYYQTIFSGTVDRVTNGPDYNGFSFFTDDPFYGTINWQNDGEATPQLVTLFQVNVNGYNFDLGAGTYYPAISGVGGPVDGDHEMWEATGSYMALNDQGLWDWLYWDGSVQFEITGIADTLNTTVVPIPGAVWLLASGLIGISGLRKRFKK
jgi:hypothetical protein